MLTFHEGHCSMELVIEELSDQISVTLRVKNHKHYA